MRCRRLPGRPFMCRRIKGRWWGAPALLLPSYKKARVIGAFQQVVFTYREQSCVSAGAHWLPVECKSELVVAIDHWLQSKKL